MTKHRARISIAVLLLIAGLYYAALPRSGRPVLGASAESASEQASPATPRKRVRLAASLDPLAVGTRRVYSARFDTQLSNAGTEGKTWFATAGKLDLDLTVLSKQGGRLLLEGKIRNPSISFGNQEQDARRHAETEHAVQKPFYLHIDAEGRIESIQQADELEPMAHSLQRYLSANLQFVRPAGAADAADWSVTENDASGVCEARYHKLAEERYQKEKIAYREHAFALNGDKPKIVASGEYTVLSNGVVEAVDAKEQIDVAFGDAQVHSQSEVSLELVRLERGQAHAVDQVGLTARVLHEAAPASAEPSDAERRELVAGADLDTLLSALSASAPGTAERARWQTQSRIVALLQLDRGMAQTLRQRLGGMSPADRAMALGSLADANTPESQRALLDVARDAESAEDVKHTAIGHLALNEAPTPETLTSLQELASAPETDPALRKSAMLALGSSAGRAAVEADTAELADQTIDGLVQQLDRQTDEEERILLMSSLGNAGSERALPALSSALEDPSVAVRSSAVTSLRTMEGDGVDALIGETLLNDDDARVRADAAIAARFRPLNETLQDALAQAIRDDADSRVRSNAIDVAGEHLEQASPAVRAALDHAQQHDADANIREQAERYLSGAYRNPEGGAVEGDEPPAEQPAAEQPPADEPAAEQPPSD